MQNGLWFNRNDYFATRIRPAGGDGIEYLFPYATSYKFVTKEIVIDGILSFWLKDILYN